MTFWGSPQIEIANRAWLLNNAMELLSILMARSVHLFETTTMNPVGQRTSFEVLNDLRQRYGFVQWPKGLNERSADGGYEFLSGRFNSIAIEKMVIYSDGIVVDTRSDTDHSEAVADDIFEYGRAIGANLAAGRKHLLSQVLFKSELRFQKLNPVLNEISSEIGMVLSGNLQQEFSLEPTGVIVNFDLTQVKVAPSKFFIERRAESPFFENTYFSSAPLGTAKHLEMLTKFERALM